MANAHKNSVLYDEKRIRREERKIERERSEQRKMERLVKHFDRKAGR